MMLRLTMAWRNLWRHRRRTWLTALAMVFSNVLLIFLISLQYGSYDMMINNTLRAFSGHLQIQQRDYRERQRMENSIAAAADLADELRRRLPEASISVRAMGFALASSESRSLGVQVVGVQPGREPGTSTLPGLLTSGRYLQGLDAAEIVIGAILARNLKVQTGDEITLLGSGRDGSLAAGIVTVVGIYDSGMADLDRGLAEVPLGWFQEAFSMGDHAHGIVLRMPSLEQVPAALELLQSTSLPRPELALLDWQTLQPGLKQAIQADLSSAWFMYAVLVVLVAFSVLNTQLMSVLERTREFGVIMALGLRPAALARLVVLETALMALLGLLLGVLCGGLVAWYFHVHGFHYPGMDELGARFNLPSRIFPTLTPFTLLLGPLVVFCFSMLAAAYPALRLMRLQPVQAMRAV